MPEDNAELVRRAYEAYARGDTDAMLEAVDPDLEWTFLDPAFDDPEPRVCRGRHELEHALRRQHAAGLRSELVEIVGEGDRVMVVIRTPGIEAVRAYSQSDLSYDVVTVRDDRVVAMRACRTRDEALAFLRG